MQPLPRLAARCPAVPLLLVLAAALHLSSAAANTNGAPPSPMEGGAPSPGGPPPGDRNDCTLSGQYTVHGETRTAENLEISSAENDVSAVFVAEGGALTLTAPAIRSTGNTSSQESSSFHGLNAAVLAATGGQIVLEGGRITTAGSGANGAFAAGAGSKLSLNGVRIETTGAGGHGVMATGGGTIVLDKTDIVTAQTQAAGLATDRGGGTVTATGGTVTTHGRGSPALYSTGTISVVGASLAATGAEGAVVEGSNSITLTGCQVTAGKLCGAMIYQSFSGDSHGQHGALQLVGGSFAAEEGPLLYVTNTHATITLKGASLSCGSGVLLQASAGRWGREGRNGGHVRLFASEQNLYGDIVCDNASSIALSLRQNSTLVGRIHTASLTIDGTSRWEVLGDSSVGALQLPIAAITQAEIPCIIGNGHIVRYDPELPANRWLKQKAYALAGGGSLVPDERPLLKR